MWLSKLFNASKPIEASLEPRQAPPPRQRVELPDSYGLDCLRDMIQLANGTPMFIALTRQIYRESPEIGEWAGGAAGFLFRDLTFVLWRATNKGRSVGRTECRLLQVYVREANMPMEISSLTEAVDLLRAGTFDADSIMMSLDLPETQLHKFMVQLGPCWLRLLTFLSSREPEKEPAILTLRAEIEATIRNRLGLDDQLTIDAALDADCSLEL